MERPSIAGKVKGKARLKVGGRGGIEHCPRRKRKGEREEKKELGRPGVGRVSLYTLAWPFVVDSRATDLAMRRYSPTCHITGEF